MFIQLTLQIPVWGVEAMAAAGASSEALGCWPLEHPARASILLLKHQNLYLEMIVGEQKHER